MKKSYECEVATHIGPESCGAARKGGVEALIGERAGRVFLQRCYLSFQWLKVPPVELLRYRRSYTRRREG
jgi:hypothetical protein